MREKLCLIVCMLIAVLVAGCTQVQDGQGFEPVEVQSAEDVMKKVHEEYDSIKGVRGTVVIESAGVFTENGFLENETTHREQDFWMKKDGLYKYRIEDKDDEGVEVSNGSVTWTNQNPFADVAIISETFSEVKKTEEDYDTIFTYAPKEDLYWWLNSSVIMPEESVMDLLGEGEVAGRECYVVEVKGQFNQTENISSRLWIDKEYYYPLKIKIEYQGENAPRNTQIHKTINSRYKSIEFNPKIDDSKFEYQIPEDAKIICYCENLSDFYRWNCSCK